MQAGASWCRVSTSEIRSLVSILWFRLLADRSKNGVCDRFRRCDKGDYIWGLGRLSQEGIPATTISCTMDPSAGELCPTYLVVMQSSSPCGNRSEMIPTTIPTSGRQLSGFKSEVMVDFILESLSACSAIRRSRLLCGPMTLSVSARPTSFSSFPITAFYLPQ